MVDFISVSKKAEQLGCEVLLDEPMKKHTSFKVGGNVPIFINVNTKESLISLVRFCEKNNIPKRIVGNGSNILVSDKGINSVIFHLCGDFTDIKLKDDTRIVCGAGVKLSKLCDFALKQELSGLEFAWGIPGLVGGATYMNAGAYGGEMKDVVVKCYYIDGKGNEHIIDDDFSFSYRHSRFSDTEDIILFVEFNLIKADYVDIKTKMDDFLSRRKEKQPLEYPSAGSTFKRPEGFYAGALIQECNLKGKTIGSAMVSDKHSGFIVNTGNATAGDIINLIKFVQETVYREKGIKLECEVKRWEDK